MEMNLSGAHQSTYDAVFQHPISRNLQWRDVRSMLNALTEMTEERTGHLKFTRNGQTLTVHPPRHKDMSDIQELMRIRHFLERSASPVHEAVAGGINLLVVIDHRLARIYKTEFHGAEPVRIVPYDAAGSGRHLHHVEGDASGQRKPELKSFYTAVVKTIEHAQKILLFGSGTGASSAMDQLLAELDLHHKDLRQRVVGSIVVDEHHMTEDQLLAKARAFYERNPSPTSDLAQAGNERLSHVGQGRAE